MDRKMTPKQIEYETRRAKAANMTLDQWLRKKSAAEAAVKAAEAPSAPKKPGLLGRLIERAHKPLQRKGTAAEAAKPGPKSKRKA